MLFAFYLRYFLSLTSIGYAHKRCLRAFNAVTNLPIGPSYVDCHHAIQYLPFFSSAAPNTSLTNSNASASFFDHIIPTSPYSPISDVISGSCMLILRYYESRVPPTMEDLKAVVEISGRPQQKLTGESIMKLWSAQRVAAQQVTQDCVRRGLGGIQWEPIDLPEMPFVWYAALLREVVTRKGRVEMEQRRLMAGVDESARRTRGWVFDGGTYYV